MAEDKTAAPALNLMPQIERAAAEAAERKEFEAREPTLAERKNMLHMQLKALESLEAKEKYGARELTPKNRLMAFDKLEELHPDRHFRWINAANETKAEQRFGIEGYTRVTEEEAQAAGCRREIGSEMVLGWIPKSQAELRVRTERKRTQLMMGSPRQEMQAMAEQVAQIMKDTYGKDIPIDRIYVQIR